MKPSSLRPSTQQQQQHSSGSHRGRDEDGDAREERYLHYSVALLQALQRNDTPSALRVATEMESVFGPSLAPNCPARVLLAAAHAELASSTSAASHDENATSDVDGEWEDEDSDTSADPTPTSASTSENDSDDEEGDEEETEKESDTGDGSAPVGALASGSSATHTVPRGLPHSPFSSPHDPWYAQTNVPAGVVTADGAANPIGNPLESAEGSTVAMQLAEILRQMPPLPAMSGGTPTTTTAVATTSSSAGVEANTVKHPAFPRSSVPSGVLNGSTTTTTTSAADVKRADDTTRKKSEKEDNREIMEGGEEEDDGLSLDALLSAVNAQVQRDMARLAIARKHR